MRWCFDTSAFIEPWVRHYPCDVFPKVWDALNDLVHNKVIGAPQDVLLELERQKDDLFHWAKARTSNLIAVPDRPVMEAYAEIVNSHPGFMKVNSTKSGADPFVVALAQVRGIPVVTYETLAKKDAAPKIPNVCLERRIDCVSLVDVLRAEGVKL